MSIIQYFKDGSRAIINNGVFTCSCKKFKYRGICQHVNELIEVVRYGNKK